jgi:KRAB domain-containing zinc finger protein
MVLCDICGKCFARTSELNRHKLTIHLKHKQKCCDLCGKNMRKDNLTQHMKTHKQEQRPLLQTEKKTLCEICGMCFSQKKELTHHQRQTHFVSGKIFSFC